MSAALPSKVRRDGNTLQRKSHLSVVSTPGHDNRSAWAQAMRDIIKYKEYDLKIAGSQQENKVPIHCVFGERHKSGDKHASAVILMDSDGFTGFNCQGCGTQLSVLDLGVAVGYANTKAEVARKLEDNFISVPESDQSIPPQQSRESEKATGMTTGTTSIHHPSLRTLRDVKTTKMKWLWPQYIPMGVIAVTQGDGGIGKTTFAMDLIARAATGREMPDGSRPFNAPVSTILIAPEDSDDKLKQKLLAAASDIDWDRVLICQGPDDAGFVLPDHAGFLRDRIEEESAKIVYIDAMFSVFGDGIEPYKATDVRRALLPLQRMAAETGCVIILNRHPTKPQKGHMTTANHRGIGSVDISNVARVVLWFGPHPTEHEIRLVSIAKHNYGKTPESLKFKIVDAVIETADGEETVGRIKHCGSDPITADEAVSAKPSKLALCRSLILQAITSKRLFVKSEIKTAADASADTVERAMKQLETDGYQFKAVNNGEHWEYRVVHNPIENDTDY